jgi:DNA N-6-adenine-methyltransferase (Dam)
MSAPTTDLVVLTKTESARLVELEAVVERGLKTFFDVGTALLEIRESRLYRQTQPTFEAYCKARFGFSDSRGRQLIAGAKTVTAVTLLGLPAPETEREARRLAPVLTELQAKYGERLTGERLRRAVDERMKSDRNTAAFLSNVSDEWYTDGPYVEAARAVLGGIDLDPASCAEAQCTVRAKRIFTIKDDGLSKPWKGRVFLNPPFSLNKRFVPKAIEEYEAGRVSAAVLVLNGQRFDAGWFQPLWHYPICFTDHRPVFKNPGKVVPPSPIGGMVFVYLGLNVERFLTVFDQFGDIVQSIGPRARQRLLGGAESD